MANFVPGPSACTARALAAHAAQRTSADLDPSFLECCYAPAAALLARLLHHHGGDEVPNRGPAVAIMTGEGMLPLWACLRSCLRRGDRVLALSTGLFGTGIGEMARTSGAEVKILEFPFNETLHDFAAIEAAVVEFKPKMITVVHCETPSGTLNPIAPIGEIKRKHNVPLLYVDMVSSLGGAEVRVDEWGVDLGMGAPHKCIAAPASVAFAYVSPKAWEVIREIAYEGYDALLPFYDAQEKFYFPYTPNWHGIAALLEGLRELFERGEEATLCATAEAARTCRARLSAMGVALYPAADAAAAPTVTAALVPDGVAWSELDRALRRRGVLLGGNYGVLAGKVFRIGHMGPVQCDLHNLAAALNALEAALMELKAK
eukprot:TRINITY_DN3244_c0_g1_i1.p1 TRINITY_DN3244_c0_g1~~TRINITY_DN3244_c0_g1_i1.p1  ORF type:complete len:391 (-),score=94.03 TRINITY_DN3244_c0_g1_i1:54-1175(-)